MQCSMMLRLYPIHCMPFLHIFHLSPAQNKHTFHSFIKLARCQTPRLTSCNLTCTAQHLQQLSRSCTTSNTSQGLTSCSLICTTPLEIQFNTLCLFKYIVIDLQFIVYTIESLYCYTYTVIQLQVIQLYMCNIVTSNYPRL